MLHFHDKVGIISCSDGIPHSHRPKIEILCYTLYTLGLIPVCSHSLYADQSGTSVNPKERADALMSLFEHKDIHAIFDVSDGDIANQMLEHLDFSFISKHPKHLFGYNDLTTILNALYSQSQLPSFLYQIHNLVSENGSQQRNDFLVSLLYNKPDLYQFKYQFIQGHEMSGTVIGGNIRCFLKLAGTPYLPDFTDKIMFLESQSGTPEFLSSCLTQLKYLDAFSKIRGILLGTFLEMEKHHRHTTIEDMVLSALDNPDVPVARTTDIGHGSNSKCLMIGKQIHLNQKMELHLG